MNQKDYKEIGEIIKRNKFKTQTETNFVWGISEHVVNDLADYFEREEKEMDEKVKDGNFIPLHKNEDDYFNREKFLKDCGVKQ